MGYVYFCDVTGRGRGVKALFYSALSAGVENPQTEVSLSVTVALDLFYPARGQRRDKEWLILSLGREINQAMKYRVIIEQDEDGMYSTECPSLPGCVSQGKTREEALSNVQDAIQGYLESLKKHNDPIPPPIQEEIVDIAL